MPAAGGASPLPLIGVTMLSILVCHSYFLHLDDKQSLRAKPYPPLATLQVVEQLRRQGHRVVFFDAMLAQDITEFHGLLETERPDCVLCYEDNFNFLSKMCLATMRAAACRMLGAARRQGARVICAGSDVSDAPEIYLRAGAELALIGEGIGTLLELLPRLVADRHADVACLTRGLSGVVSAGAPPAGPARPRSALLPELGPAAWDLVDMAGYRALWRRAHGYFSLNMAASRGCPFRCNWCSKPIWGNHYLQRPAQDVAAEMALLKRRFAPDHIWFADDIFGFRVDWVEDLAAQLAAHDVQIPFTIQTRADLVSESMAVALQRAGCREAWLGAESGSQKVLDAMRKGTTVQEILVARKRLREVGIRVGFFIQLGYLDEQLDDLLATRELLRIAEPDDIGVSVSYPLPGTQFHAQVQAQLRGKTRWRESNDLDMMFEGTYRSDFYRAVRNLLHDQVSLQGSPARSAARATLEQGWQELLAREGEFRGAGDSMLTA